MKRRILSIITALALCLSLCPTWAFATEADPSLCKHHPEHTEDCGYIAPTEGHDCGHRHTAECYTLGVLPDADGGDYYEIGADTENLLDCQHSHDSACGYVQADPGQPCGYACRICAIEALIAALPEQVTEDNAEVVRARLDEILDLFTALNEDEQGQLDLSRVTELQGALDNANAPIAVAEEINIDSSRENILTAEAEGCSGHTFTGTTEWDARIYVESGTHDVTFSNLSITKSANVGIAPGATMNLIIEGTNTIKSYNSAGIYVPVGATLVINGTGSLDVSGDRGGAGIGGATYAPDETGSDGNPNCGTVEINGGTITATGGSCCAGIGGGDAYPNPGNGGNVTINGGTVTATGGSDNYYGGAGIGGGGGVLNEWNELLSGSGGTLTINGGHVTLAPGQYDSTNSTAYGFGRGSSDPNTSAGTCELTLADESYLDSSTTLDPNGKYTINGDPTEDMIVVPTDLVYNGKAQELDGKIYIDDSKTGTGTYFNQTFTVKASADGWTYAINPSEVKAAGDYTVTFSKEGHTSISKTFTVAKSGTQFVGDGEVKTYKDGAECSDFTAGDTITVKAAPTPTGEAPTNSAMFAASFTPPTTGQMAVFVSDTQVSAPVGVGADGTYTMEVSAADVLLAARGPGTEIPLTAKFVENNNMADGTGTVTVSITAVAVAERDGNVIDYFGVSNFEGKNNLFCQNDYADATITLLGDVQPGTNSDAGTTCSTMVNITCTLDLAGHNFTSTDTAIYVLPMGNLTIQDSSTGKTGNVSYIKSDGTLTLYGGTFGKIETAYTLSSLLAENCAYYRGSTPILLSELEGQKTLDGTVTVQECQHTGVEVKDLGSGKHGLDCPYCGYHSEHTTTLTATVSGNTVTFRGGCESCDYRAETLATAAFTIPKLTYGQTDQTVSCTWEHPNGYALMVQIDSGEELQLESSDTQVSLPLKQLFGSQEINAGNYQLHVYCRSYADVTSNVCSLPVTVDPAPLPEVTLSAESATYSGTEQKPALSVQQGETALTEGTDYEVSYTRDGVVTTDFTNAGTVNITVTGKGNYTGSVEKTYTIGKATPTIAWNPTDVETIYTGQPADVKPVVTLVNGETYSGEIHYSWYGVADSLVPPTDARTYGNIKASIPEQDNYNTAITQIGLNLHIDYADQAAPAAPAATEENIKDTSITLTIIANAEYKRGDGEWQESPTFTGLEPNQAYTFYARLKADRNHNASTSSAGTSITTRKAMLENASVTITGTYTYTGAAIVPEAGNVEVVLNGTKIDSDQYTISASNNINAGVGKATLTVTATETGNYSGSVSTTFSIGKATLYVAPNSQTIRYGESIREGASAILTRGLATGDHVVGVTLTPDTKDVPGGKIIASEVQIQNESGADVTGNYEITYVPGALIINKSQPTIAFADGYNPGKTYDGQTIPNPVEANLTITGATFGDVAFAWSATPKDAGTYTLTANIPETDNTAAASTSPLTVTISKATLTATSATVASKPYDGTDTAIVSGVTFTGLVNGETLALGTDYTATGKFDSVSAGTGKNVTVTVTLTSDKAKNYSLAQNTTTATGTINRASSSITTAPTASGITYGQALSGSTLTGGGAVSGDITIAGTWNWTAPDTKPNAGTAQYEVTFTPTDTNYDTATVNVSVTVAKATPTLTAPTAGAIQYGQKLSDSTLTGGTATNPNDSATVAGSWSWANGNTQPTATGTFPVAFVPSDTANYNTPENVDTSVTVNPAEPKITLTVPAYQVANGVVEVKYTAANPHDATLNDLPAVTLAYKVGSGAEQPITDGKFTIPEGTAVGTVITVTASTAAVDGKYTAAAKTATVTVTDKIPVEISGVGVTGRAYNGKAIDHTGTPVIKTLDGKTVTDATVTYTWSSGGDTGPINAGNYTLTISVGGEKYIGSTTVDFTIEKATVTITAANKSAVVGSAQPELTYTVSGLADGETLDTVPTLTCTPDMNTVGSYPITASGAAVPNTGNYNATITYVDGTLSVTAKPSTGGGGYVPSNPGGSTLPVTTTGQGSSTTTTTTTAAPTASVNNGTATTAINTAMGNEIVKQAVANKSEEVVIAPNVTGSVTKAEVSIPASTVGQIGSQTNASLTVSTPVADVTIPNGGLGSLSSAGGTVTVTAEQVGSSVELTVTAGGRTIQNVPGGVTLTVPAANTTPGTVAVLVHPDGTREVVRKSVANNGAVTIPLDGSAKLEIVDNSRQFADVPATSWAADAVAFASAHELFGGTGANQFSPDLPMSRGMLAVVLHNLENNPAQALTGAFADVDNSQWYAEGVAWAEAQGIIGGYGNGRFGPNDNITREQLAVMLWRYSGSPAATDRELHFADAHRASDWALDALRWATENGIINGKGGGILDPTGQATRAEAAQMLKNFMEDR